MEVCDNEFDPIEARGLTLGKAEQQLRMWHIQKQFDERLAKAQREELRDHE